ncbi:MAG: hypothetical protein ACPGK1_15595, partial [bacterium]
CLTTAPVKASFRQVGFFRNRPEWAVSHESISITDSIKFSWKMESVFLGEPMQFEHHQNPLPDGHRDVAGWKNKSRLINETSC